jgi:hypothetical protein
MQPGWRKTKDSEFLSHWNKPFEDFNTSPSDFYTVVETAFLKHEAPDAEVSRVTWKERGLLSAERIYLRFERGKHVCDVCAAPFGKDFFFSSWLVMIPPSLTLMHWFGMGITFFFFPFLSGLLGFFKGLFFLVAALLFLWYSIRAESVKVNTEIEEFLLGLTVIGAYYDVFKRKPTYFEIDAGLMFQSVIHAAVLEAVDALTDAKGLPRLGDSERKPINRDFFQR